MQDHFVRSQFLCLFQLALLPSRRGDHRAPASISRFGLRRCPLRCLPARIRTCSPGSSRARVISMCQAVRNTSGTAAASSKIKSPGGIGSDVGLRGAFTYSAQPPLRSCSRTKCSEGKDCPSPAAHARKGRKKLPGRAERRLADDVHRCHEFEPTFGDLAGDIRSRNVRKRKRHAVNARAAPRNPNG